MEKEKPKSASELRRSVYDYLHKQGIELPPSGKTGLSKLLKSVYEHRVIASNNPEPLIHKIECPKCLDVVIKVGRLGKVYVQRRNRAKNFAKFTPHPKQEGGEEV